MHTKIAQNKLLRQAKYFFMKIRKTFLENRSNIHDEEKEQDDPALLYTQIIILGSKNTREIVFSGITSLEYGYDAFSN